MTSSEQLGHHIGWTGPATRPILPGLLDAHLELQLPGADPLVSRPSIDNEVKSIYHQLSQNAMPGTRVTFQDVDYLVRNRANRKQKIKILCQVSGFFNPGEMVAVMGPSGSGMSTAC